MVIVSIDLHNHIETKHIESNNRDFSIDNEDFGEEIGK